MNDVKVLIFGNDQTVKYVDSPARRFHKLNIAGPILSETLEKAGFKVTLTEDLDMLEKENASRFDAFLCYYWLGKLTREQQEGLLDAVSSGKGFVGLHSAADSFRENHGYPSLLGGIFRTHPPSQTLHIQVSDRNHPITKDISDFDIYDELYILYHDPKRYQLLLHCMWEGDKQPVAWVREHGKGRVFYMSLGHSEEALGNRNTQALENKNFQKILAQGVRWVTDRPIDRQ